MSTITPIQPRPVNVPQAPQSIGVKGPDKANPFTGYKDTDEVRLRANVMTGNQNPELTKALSRLDANIKSEAPPRDDVPRGYYLDILV